MLSMTNSKAKEHTLQEARVFKLLIFRSVLTESPTVFYQTVLAVLAEPVVSLSTKPLLVLKHAALPFSWHASI